MEKVKRMFREIDGGVWVSVAVNFMLWIYAPVELLFTNQDEFWFDVYILLPVMALVFVVGSVISIFMFGLARIINQKIYRLVLILYFSGFLCLYVQGNFLTEGLPPLDGSVIDWSLYGMERIKSVGVWILVPLIVVVASRLKREIVLKAVKVVSICMTLMLCVTLGTLAMTHKGFSEKPSMGITTRNLFQMSQDTNFVILVLDAIDGDAMEDVLAADSEYQELFEDFTFYNNMVSAYPYTKYAVPHMLSGEWYEYQKEFDEYQKEVYAASPLFETLENSGYSMGLYTEDILSEDNIVGRFENILPNERGVNDKWAFARWQMLMTGFRYAPYDLKRFSFVNPNAFKDLKLAPEGEKIYSLSNKQFYEDLCQTEIQYADHPCFKFIHINGGHVPFMYDKDMNEIKNGTYEESIQASLTITKAYLDKLKKSGIYDNTAIIVMADHGSYIEGGNHPYGRTHPIFFAKGIHEKHALQVSDAPVSFDDLQEAYQRLLSGGNGDQIFEWKSGDQRERRFLCYEYGVEEYMSECMQTGKADDISTIYETGKIYTR